MWADAVVTAGEAAVQLREIMTTRVATITQDAPAEEAFNRMRQQDIHHLVVEHGGEVVGVLSATDLGAFWEEVRKGRPITELMTPEPVTVGPDTTTAEAARLLRGRNIGCLPIMDRDDLVGIVTISDLLELMGSASPE